MVWKVAQQLLAPFQLCVIICCNEFFGRTFLNSNISSSGLHGWSWWPFPDLSQFYWIHNVLRVHSLDSMQDSTQCQCSLLQLMSKAIQCLTGNPLCLSLRSCATAHLSCSYYSCFAENFHQSLDCFNMVNCCLWVKKNSINYYNCRDGYNKYRIATNSVQ